MLPFYNTNLKVKRGDHKGVILKITSMYTSRRGKILAVTDYLLEGKKTNFKTAKRKLVISPYNLTNDLS